MTKSVTNHLTKHPAIAGNGCPCRQWSPCARWLGFDGPGTALLRTLSTQSPAVEFFNAEF
jgi:hypothetical protein